MTEIAETVKKEYFSTLNDLKRGLEPKEFQKMQEFVKKLVKLEIDMMEKYGEIYV